MPKNLGVNTIPDPIGHFGAPWQLFWIFEVLIGGMIEPKNSFSNNLGVDIFPDPIGHFDEASGDPLQAVSKNPPLR